MSAISSRKYKADVYSNFILAVSNSCLVFVLFFSPQLFLPSMRKKSSSGTAEGSVDGDTLTAHWLVDDMLTFENVGFTKDVGKIKYLICADCEIGPIGWHCLDDKKKFYVALDRVNHA